MGHSIPPIWRARLAGRSYWGVRLWDGTLRCEWEPGADWLQLVEQGQRGIREAYLFCPSGQVAVLGDADVQGRQCDLRGRLFQFKHALRPLATITNGPGGPLPPPRETFQALGRVDAPNGDCTLYAWEYEPGSLFRAQVGSLTVRIADQGRGRLVGPIPSNLERLGFAGTFPGVNLAFAHLGTAL